MKRKCKKINEDKSFTSIVHYPLLQTAERAAELLRLAEIPVSISVNDKSNERGMRTKHPTLWVPSEDARRAEKILETSRKLERKIAKGPLKLPPDENTLGFLDMLIHDCRQYLMIATGELKSIQEEGELELDDPTEDIEKITIRLKRLKDQCMRQARRRPLDWQK